MVGKAVVGVGLFTYARCGSIVVFTEYPVAELRAVRKATNSIRAIPTHA